MADVAENFKPIDASQEIGKLARRVDLIRQSANESKPIDFDEKWIAVLLRCAEWHSSQPLSPELYREPGGAIRWTAELAFFAMRLAGGQKFATNLPSEERRRVEPQYNYGVFIAAVCTGLDEPHRHFRAIRLRDSAEWNPSAHGPLNSWLAGSDYRLIRREVALPVERMRTGVLAQLIVGHEQLSKLDAEVIAQSFGAINPPAMPVGAETVTQKVVREAVKVATDFDLRAQRSVFTPVQFRVPPSSEVENLLVPVPDAAPPPPPAVGAGSANEEKGPSAAASTNEALTLPPKAAPIGKPVDPRQISLLDVPTGSEDAGTTASIAPEPPQTLEDLLKGDAMIVELFHALKEDVAAGKAKVEWSRFGLDIPKKSLGGYGVSTDTLIEALRKKSMILANSKTLITVAAKIGEFILPRESA